MLIDHPNEEGIWAASKLIDELATLRNRLITKFENFNPMHRRMLDLIGFLKVLNESKFGNSETIEFSLLDVEKELSELPKLTKDKCQEESSRIVEERLVEAIYRLETREYGFGTVLI